MKRSRRRRQAADDFPMTFLPGHIGRAADDAMSSVLATDRARRTRAATERAR